MVQGAGERAQTFRARELSEAVTHALNYLLPAPGQGSEAGFTLVFSGEAASPEEALLAALDDILAQGGDHGGTPVEAKTDAVYPTDVGTRIWGTVSCIPGSPLPVPALPSLTITIHQEPTDTWTIRIETA